MDVLTPYLHLSTDLKIWAVQLLGIAFVTVCLNFVLMRVLDTVARVTAKTASNWDDALLKAARLPLRLLVWVLGMSVAARLVLAIHPGLDFSHLPEVRRVAVIAILALFVFRLIHNFEKQLLDNGRGGKPVDVTTTKAIGKLLRLVVTVIAALLAMQAMGFSVSGLVAAGGVGGLAVGFAAKDLLANFFGALMIYWDKPFKEGDWIRSPDRDIEGTVEEIGWRLTRIRTFDKRPLYVPNSAFASITVENPSRMLNRRIKETLGIRYDDAAQVTAICDAIREMVRTHPELDQNTTQIVHFDSFGASSLDILLYCFTQTTKWVEYHRVKQDVLLKVMDIVSAHGAEFAFPTQTLHAPELADMAGMQVALSPSRGNPQPA
ncbi:mechanosensitive ion channel family protein [Ottowia sp.]|uniref:mechanosensitive ion channel family protein n=1 Tax=Ottowia sp. TaxID=1898956 RepID=UPI003A884BB3